ncbi:MAG: hypothetical protein ACREXY_24865, partial [Gammaproteobacteria bacterium]
YEERVAREWTLKDALDRKASGNADPADRKLIEAYYNVWQVISDNPDCVEPEELDEARRILKNR